jgi:nucleotide-binding universal stress UspA family protein
VADESEELQAALRFACRRAQRTRGHVAILAAIEPGDLQPWLGVGEVMASERRREAERRLQALAGRAYDLTGAVSCLHIREGRPRDELIRLLEEEPAISVVVLGTAPGRANPGPLVSELVSQMGGAVRTPLTLVPGHLSAEAIDAVA